MNRKPPAQILVIKLGALGDFIQALGPMAAIRKHHREDTITLLTTAPFAEIAKASGYFNSILIDRRPKWHDIKGWLELRRQMNAGKFSRVYDLQNNDRTGFYLKLFKDAPEWVGAARGASHRNASPERTQRRAFDGHVQTLALAGIGGVEIDHLSWMKPVTDFGLAKPYVLIVPGSAAQHPEKRWPAIKYAALCQNLLKDGYMPVLLGAASESDVLDEIHAKVPQSLNLCGMTSLMDLPALARGAAGAVGNDTGPMHLIAPTGCGTVVLFSGSTKPHRHAPMGERVVTIQRDRLEYLDVEDVWSAFTRQYIAPEP